MNINTKHIIHASDCSLWHHSGGVYICDCGALMRARYECSDNLSDDEREMIILHGLQIDQLKDDLPAKDGIPANNIYTSGKKEASEEITALDIPEDITEFSDLIDYIRSNIEVRDVPQEVIRFYKEYQLRDEYYDKEG